VESRGTLVMAVRAVRKSDPRRSGIERFSTYVSLGVAGVTLLVLGLLVMGLDIEVGTALVAVGLAHVAYAWRRLSAVLVKRAPLYAVHSGNRRGSR